MLDITMDGLGVSSKPHKQLEAMILPPIKMEIRSVKIISGLMQNGQHSMTDFIYQTWMTPHKKHGNGGLGQLLTKELGDIGDISILTIEEEPGFILQTKKLEIVLTFEDFDDTNIYL